MEPVTIPGQDASTLIAQYYIQYENGAKPSENLSSFVSADRRGFRIAARTRTAPSTTLLAAFARLREILATEFPELAGSPEALGRAEALTSVMFSGKQYLFTNMFRRFSNTLIVSLGLALSVITVLIGLVFRQQLNPPGHHRNEGLPEAGREILRLRVRPHRRSCTSP